MRLPVSLYGNIFQSLPSLVVMPSGDFRYCFYELLILNLILLPVSTGDGHSMARLDNLMADLNPIRVIASGITYQSTCKQGLRQTRKLRQCTN